MHRFSRGTCARAKSPQEGFDMTIFGVALASGQGAEGKQTSISHAGKIDRPRSHRHQAFNPRPVAQAGR